MRHAIVTVLLGVLALAATHARADSLDDTFTRGNRAFARGDYESAVREYAKLTEAGVDDPDVAYNLASAHAALGHYGQAIRHFEHTLELAPSDEQARAQLKLVREALGQRQALETGEALVEDRPPLAEALFGGISEDTLSYALLVTAWLASVAGLGLLVLRTEAARLTCGILASTGVLLALASGLGVLVKADWGREGQRAVVLHEQAPLREGPDDFAQLVEELPEGVHVRLLAREAAFVRVRLPRGREGYMRAADVGAI